jgi:hypothetical protein
VTTQITPNNQISHTIVAADYKQHGNKGHRNFLPASKEAVSLLREMPSKVPYVTQ